MKTKYFIPAVLSLIIAATLLYTTCRSCPKSECYICSGQFQSLISYDSAFGIINLNSRNVSTIPKGDWSDKNSVRINTTQNGSTIMLSSEMSGCYRADIYLQKGSCPDKAIMSDYLCQDCVENYSSIKYDVILMEAASGSIYQISSLMQLELPPYQVTAVPQEIPDLIRLCFKKIE